MSEGNIPIDYNFKKHPLATSSGFEKTNYDKMLIITFLSFISTRFLMGLPCLPGK